MKYWNIKYFFRAMIPFLLLVTNSACSTTGTAEQHTAAPDLQAGNDILAAIRSGDYDRFTERCGNLYSEDEFKNAKLDLEKRFGEIRSFRCLAPLAAPPLRDRVWIVAFERQDGSGRTVRRELLFRLVSGMDEDGLKIIAFSFI